MIRHLLIDLDGTLIHQTDHFFTQFKFMSKLLPKLRHNQGWGVAWRNLRQGGVALATGDAERTNFLRMVHVIQKNLNIPLEQAQTLLIEGLNFAYPTLKQYFKPLIGAAEFIDWAHSRYSLILATNPVWPVELVKERMKWGGIDPTHFKKITTFDQMHFTKPDPRFYQEILDQEKLDVKECFMIGNEEKMDVPATQIGIPVFLIDQRFPRMVELRTLAPNPPGVWKGSFEHLKKFLSEQESLA